MSNVLYIGIDLQDGFLTDEIRQTGYISKVETFLAQQNKETVVLTQFVNHPASNFEKLLDWPDMQKADADTALFGTLEQQGYDIVQKSGYTGWVPQVQAKAEKIGATKFVIFGLDSDACVLKTALDVFEAGYRPIVLSDLSQSSGGPERHDRGVKLLEILIGERQVTTSKELGH